MFLDKIQFEYDEDVAEFSWQIKLLVIVCGMNKPDERLRAALMTCLRNEDYLVSYYWLVVRRSWGISGLC